MPIVSVSLNDEIIREMDRLQQELGFSGKSELMRAGIRQLAAEEKDRQGLSGHIYALLLAVHDEKSDYEVTEMGHAFDKLVGTHIHNKIDRDRCLEIFLLEGQAKEITEMVKNFRANKKMYQVKLVAL
jgi:CopG family transcriptional regulator, nickel-responsive regulator